MKILFLGTGAAEGVPAIYCNCDTCTEVRRRGEGEYHTRSQVLVDEKVGIDFPPDAYYHSLRHNLPLSSIEHLLITHSHMDHFYAHDFILRGYKYMKGELPPLHIYGNAEVVSVFNECTKRELRPEIGQQIILHEVQPFQPFAFEGYTAVALKAQHSVKEQAYVYLLEKDGKIYLHLTDTGRLPKESIEYLKSYFAGRDEKVGLVTFDCTFLFHTAGEVSRHMGLGDNAATRRIFEEINIVNEHTRYVITHYSHNGNPLRETLERAEREYGVIAAYDGTKIEF